jgi:hypothetical protein
MAQIPDSPPPMLTMSRLSLPLLSNELGMRTASLLLLLAPRCHLIWTRLLKSNLRDNQVPAEIALVPGPVLGQSTQGTSGEEEQS